MNSSVTENGFAVKDENSKPLEEVVQDADRVEYFTGATESLLAARNEDGVDVRSYFAWSQSFNNFAFLLIPFYIESRGLPILASGLRSVG